MLQRLPPALQERDFRFLWSAIFSMRFAENMIAVAVGWQVFAIHRDPLDLGLVGLAEFVPLLLLALPAGHLADRLPRRLVAALSLAVMVGVAAALLAVTVADAQVVWPYFVLAALTGAASAIGWPAYGALTPEVVPPDLVPGAVALRSVAGQIAVIAGPAVGGLLFAWRPEAGLRGRRRAVRRRRDLGRRSARPDAHERRNGRARGPGRRDPVRLAHSHAARSDHARPVRGAGRRRGGAVADLRARDPPCRAGRPRRPARGTRGRRARRRRDPRSSAAAPRRRPDVDRSRHPLRRGQHRLGRVEVAAAHARGARASPASST